MQKGLLYTAILSAVLIPLGWFAPYAIQSVFGPSNDLGIIEESGRSNSGCGIDGLAMLSPIPKVNTPNESLSSESIRNIESVPSSEFWETAYVQLNLTASDQSSFTILSIEIEDRQELQAPPIWIYARGYGGCGSAGDTSIALTAHIDTPSVRPQTASTTSAPYQGPAFDPVSVTKDASAILKIQNRACHKNWQYSLKMTYQKAGESQPRFKIFGPYKVYGTNSETPIFLADPNGALTPAKLEDRLVQLFGHGQDCT